MNSKQFISLLGWAGTLAVIIACLWPVWTDWSGSVVGPFGGIDALLQIGLLEWSARHWTQPAVWLDLPIFHPLPGGIGFMDTLLGQAWLVTPFSYLLRLSPVSQYNLAFLGSLLLSAAGMAALWRASGGRWGLAGVAALGLIGAPFTLSQLGHLNQLPPPFVLFSLAALVVALERREKNQRCWFHLCLLGGALAMQAAWGWYGFAYAVLGVATLKIGWLLGGSRNRRAAPGLIRAAIPPVLLCAACVWWLAQPQLQLGNRYESFTRTSAEVQQGSADIQHLLNRGVYRSGPDDWTGRGESGETRFTDKARQVLNPGWLLILLAALGLRGADRLKARQRRIGWSLLAMGILGLILAFGDSVGLPFTDKRLPLPMAALREIVPPFRAFRGVWRFSWLLVIALSWWAAVGIDHLLLCCRERLPKLGVAPAALAVGLLCVLSLPVAVPAIRPALSGEASDIQRTGAVLTLPAPVAEYEEDAVEALWLLRALETGLPVTGGATGWVPPEIKSLRARLQDCETGRADAADLFREMRQAGVLRAEIALRPGDTERIEFWRRSLLADGAVRDEPWPRPGYRMFRWEEN
jgi:hypothetical protein